MNLRRFFGWLPSITTVVLGIISFVSCPITSAVVGTTTAELPDAISCPELFHVLNTELLVPNEYWQVVCNSRLGGGDESGNESGNESGHESGNESGDESGNESSSITRFCNFICNDYHKGCRELANHIFSNAYWVRHIRWSKQKFLVVCISWQEYGLETNHNTTIGTTTATATGTTSNPSTTITTTTRTTNETETTSGYTTTYFESEHSEKNKLAGDIGILTTLGLAIFGAFGVAIYFCWKRP